MKKTFYLLGIFLISLITSCTGNEENIINDAEKLSQPANKTASKFASKGEVLEFKSFEDFENTIEKLYLEIEAYDDAFLKKYGHLSEDELDDVEDELNYNDFQPVVDYEKQQNFRSLRAIIAEKESKWLEEQEGREFLDEKTDPDNHFVVDDVERALLNEHSEVKIGDDFYKYYEWGLVKTKSYESLVRSRLLSRQNSTVPVLTDLDFIVIYNDPFGGGSGSGTGSGTGSGSSTTTGCKRTITREHRYTNGHNGRRSIKVKHKVRLNQFAGAPKIVTIVKGYKKRRRKWRKRRTPIGIQFNGKCLENCDQELMVSKYKSVRRRRSRRAKITGGDWWNTGAGTLKFGIINEGIKVKATQYSWSISKDLYDNSHMSN